MLNYIIYYAHEAHYNTDPIPEKLPCLCQIADLLGPQDGDPEFHRLQEEI